MELKPQKPIKQYRFQLRMTYNNGEEISAILAGDQDAEMDALLQQLTQFLKPARPVSFIAIDIGDGKDRWETKQDDTALPGLNTIEDIN